MSNFIHDESPSGFRYARAFWQCVGQTNRVVDGVVGAASADHGTSLQAGTVLIHRI